MRRLRNQIHLRSGPPASSLASLLRPVTSVPALEQSMSLPLSSLLPALHPPLPPPSLRPQLPTLHSPPSTPHPPLPTLHSPLPQFTDKLNPTELTTITRPKSHNRADNDALVTEALKGGGRHPLHPWCHYTPADVTLALGTASRRADSENSHSGFLRHLSCQLWMVFKGSNPGAELADWRVYLTIDGTSVDGCCGVECE